MTDKPLMLAGVIQNSIVDGPGIRMTVFTQGCPHHCPGCHNPQTHPFEGGEPTTVEQLIERLQGDPLVRGITLSGGEPFCQAAPLARFAQYCRQHGLETAAYSGYTFEELLEMSKQDEGVLALLQQLDMLALPSTHNRRKQLEFRTRRQLHNLIDHLIDGLSGNLFATLRAMRDSDTCVQQTQIIVDLSHRSNRGTRVPVR